jgi:hypothetical protein
MLGENQALSQEFKMKAQPEGSLNHINWVNACFHFNAQLLLVHLSAKVRLENSVKWYFNCETSSYFFCKKIHLL